MAHKSKFIRLPAKTTIESEYGTHIDSFSKVAQEYWGTLKLEISESIDDRGRTITSYSGTITIKNKPVLLVTDKLRDKATGNEYFITGILEGDNQLIVNVTR